MPPPGLGSNYGSGTTTKGRKSSGKSGHSRSYPRGVGLDFRKLAGLTLVSYIDHHGTYTKAARALLVSKTRVEIVVVVVVVLVVVVVVVEVSEVMLSSHHKCWFFTHTHTHTHTQE